MTLGQKVPIWLDCDPGNDDAFAILLGACHPQFHMVGISTVYGNAPLSSTTHNTLGLLDILGFKQDEIKVYSGASEPLEIPPRFALNIHGTTGIQGVLLPKNPRVSESNDQTYLEAMREAVLKYKGELNIVCTGTLTNMSNFITEYPELRSKIKLVSIMGGGLNIGNVTPYAEFNVRSDPKASNIVLNDEILKSKTILVPLNITHKAIVTESIRNEIYNEVNNSHIRQVFFDITNEFAKVYKLVQDFNDGPPVHDPLSMFVLLAMLNRQQNEDDFNLEFLRGTISVVQTGIREGETIFSDDDSNGLYIATDINIGSFWKYTLEALDCVDLKLMKN
ncbi:uridine nucleosidase [[Candida] anglica]|uniref:Uridine nucleosidase n=1 Tax=[Candida] anglica TaxID=148631 RepID=A0ABP0EMH2_9ASCO